MDVEITVWSVNATTPAQSVDRIKTQYDGESAGIASRRSIFDPMLGQSVDAAIVLRDDMNTGQTVQGPAAITEDETTIILPSSRRAIRQADGCIDITIAHQEG